MKLTAHPQYKQESILIPITNKTEHSLHCAAKEEEEEMLYYTTKITTTLDIRE